MSCLVPGLRRHRIADSTRNRPDEPPSEVTAPDHHFVADVLKEQTRPAAATPTRSPRSSSTRCAPEQFWIPTTDGFDALIRGRYDALLERAMPPTAQFD